MVCVRYARLYAYVCKNVRNLHKFTGILGGLHIYVYGLFEWIALRFSKQSSQVNCACITVVDVNERMLVPNRCSLMSST